MKSIPELCDDRPDVTAIAFDFMQNVPLPQLPGSEMECYPFKSRPFLC